MPSRLSRELVGLLEEVLRGRDPALLSVVGAVDVRNLAHEVRVQLSRLVTEELAESGLLTDFTPSPRGARLEALIDALEPWREDTEAQ